MKKILIVVDMQYDFIDGSLGTEEAASIVENVAQKIKNHEGEIFLTLDTHDADYMQTQEGKKLPVKHCVKMTRGWMLHERILKALEGKRHHFFEKSAFASLELAEEIKRRMEDMENKEAIEIELVGLCTDICIVSNALLLKANFPELPIAVDAGCCAGVTIQSHQAALETMKMCQIEII